MRVLNEEKDSRQLKNQTAASDVERHIAVRVCSDSPRLLADRAECHRLKSKCDRQSQSFWVHDMLIEQFHAERASSVKQQTSARCGPSASDHAFSSHADANQTRTKTGS